MWARISAVNLEPTTARPATPAAAIPTVASTRSRIVVTFTDGA